MPRAERDLAALLEYVQAGHSKAARQWYAALKSAIFSLARNPSRCPRTPESKNLRHLLFGSRRDVYRVIYRVSAARRDVAILHIRHGMMGGLDVAEFK